MKNSRIIKFRGKSINKNKWVYGTPGNDNGEMYINDGGRLYAAIKVFPESIGEFTGLKDKNGKEIYEGDLFKIESEKITVVSWNEKYASFCLDRNGWAFHHWFGESCNPNECGIVGNIFENKEL